MQHSYLLYTCNSSYSLFNISFLYQHFFSLYNIPILLYNTPMPCTTFLFLIPHFYSSYSICPLCNTFLLLAQHPYTLYNIHTSYLYIRVQQSNSLYNIHTFSSVQYSYILYKSPTLFSLENSY